MCKVVRVKPEDWVHSRNPLLLSCFVMPVSQQRGWSVAAGVARLAACLGKLDVFGDKAVSVSSGSPMSVATNS